tara:strand:- start:2218 stop:3114 length:897 start_codon:yes stop_codon:yes gene_type:complete
MKKERMGILSSLSDWLKLLGLIVLVAEATILTAIATDFETSFKGWYPVAMLLFLAVIVIGIFIDRKQPSRVIPNLSTNIPESSNDKLNEIIENLDISDKFEVKVFKDEIISEIGNFLIKTRDWRNGQLRVPSGRYSQVLLDLYENAESNIFSTTIKDYLTEWDEALMRNMIKAAEQSKASLIERVFVFDSRENIDSRSIEILRAFSKLERIKSYVYIDGEDKNFQFPADVSKDFVVIDQGSAIGVTISYGRNEMSANWYFQDDERKSAFLQRVSSLKQGSKSVGEILEWWDTEIVKGK